MAQLAHHTKVPFFYKKKITNIMFYKYMFKNNFCRMLRTSEIENGVTGIF